MAKFIAIVLFVLLIPQSTTQKEFVTKSELLIKSMLNDYEIIDTEKAINNYASVGASWRKQIKLKSKKLFLNKYGQKDYQEYTFTFLFFADQVSLLKARLNYLDNYSFAGKLSAVSKGVKRPPSFNLITESSIIILEVSCEGHKMDEKWSWGRVKSNLVSIFEAEKGEIIENGCGGLVTWENNMKK